MTISDADKKQIFLVTKAELDNVDINYAHNDRLYRDVLDRIHSLVKDCQKIKLPEAIRDVKKRPTVLKRPEAIKEKILRKRAEGWKKNTVDKDYNIDSVNDIIGLKIICGYISDQPSIEGWIDDTFNVQQRDFVEYATGYKSWHYIVRLKEGEGGVPDDWKSVNCEIQLKTLLQVAWDEKTHDLVYKKEDVSEFERRRFALLSESLYLADKQSEMIRLEIEEEQREREERRQAALRAYFMVAGEEIARVVGYETREKISKGEAKKLIRKMERTAKKNYKIKNLESSRKPKTQLLGLGVRITLETLDEEVTQWTLRYAEELYAQHQSDAFICRAVATAYWALGNKYASLEAVLKALDNAERENNSEERNNAIRGLVHFIADYGREDLKELGNRLLGELRDDAPGALETKAYFLIKMATNLTELQRGMVYLKDVLSLAEQSCNQGIKHTARAFYELDEAIACRKLMGFRLAQKLPQPVQYD